MACVGLLLRAEEALSSGQCWGLCLCVGIQVARACGLEGEGEAWVRSLCPPPGESSAQRGLLEPIISGAAGGTAPVEIPCCGMGPPL